MPPSVSPATATTVLKTEHGVYALKSALRGLTTVITRPVIGSIATAAPPVDPRARRQASPTIRSRSEASGGTMTLGSAGVRTGRRGRGGAGPTGAAGRSGGGGVGATTGEAARTRRRAAVPRDALPSMQPID